MYATWRSFHQFGRKRTQVSAKHWLPVGVDDCWLSGIPESTNKGALLRTETTDPKVIKALSWMTLRKVSVAAHSKHSVAIGISYGLMFWIQRVHVVSYQLLFKSVFYNKCITEADRQTASPVSGSASASTHKALWGPLARYTACVTKRCSSASYGFYIWRDKGLHLPIRHGQQRCP